MLKLGENLIRYRKKRGLTQADVADVLGISRVSYSRYESGTREPDLGTVVTLADFFGVTVDELVGHASDQSHKGLKIGNTVEDDKSISHALSQISSYSGKKITDHDRYTLASIIEVYLASRN